MLRSRRIRSSTTCTAILLSVTRANVRALTCCQARLRPRCARAPRHRRHLKWQIHKPRMSAGKTRAYQPTGAGSLSSARPGKSSHVPWRTWPQPAPAFTFQASLGCHGSSGWRSTAKSALNIAGSFGRMAKGSAYRLSELKARQSAN